MPKPHLLVPRRSFIGAAALLSLGASFAPTLAFADTAAEKRAQADAVRNQLLGLNVELEARSEDYYRAVDELEAAQKSMQEQQTKIDDATAQISHLQQHLSTRARSMYRNGSTSVFDFVLGAASFGELTKNWDILSNLNESDAKMVAQAKELRKQIQLAKAEYSRQEKIASDKAAQAKKIKDELQAQIDQSTGLMNSLDAEARTLLEEEQRKNAIEESKKKEAEMNRRPTNNTPSNNPTPSGNIPAHGSVVDYAMSRIGCRYIMGDEGPNTFDCSGLVTWSYRQVGILLPHQSEYQHNAARAVVSIDQARPGDVLWRKDHVGIAINHGGTHYVHAPKPNAFVRDTDSLAWSGFTHALQF